MLWMRSSIFAICTSIKGGKALVMEIFEVSKSFPVEERYALTDQVRRSCRSICANLAEAWEKKAIPCGVRGEAQRCGNRGE